MAANTTIEWATKSWNPVRGCSRVSPGCDNCYAMKFAHRFSGPGKPYEGLTVYREKSMKRPGVDWNGVARFIPSELDAPLRWKRPERIFVNSMSDLFHHSLTNEQIAAVFGVMAACPRHTFQVLTKRPERALKFFDWMRDEARQESDELSYEFALAHEYAEVLGDGSNGDWGAKYDLLMGRIRDGYRPELRDLPWPLPNVWLGTSVENQETADERWNLLSQLPAAVHWLSMEPLLGPVTMRHWATLPGWIVVGGESGPGARPLDIAWVRSLVAQCRAASVPVFFKQGGSSQRCAHDSKGGHFECFPKDLRVREFPNARS